MPLKREGFRIIAYCSLLLAYSTFMVDKAVNIRHGILFSLSLYSSDTLVIPVPDHLLQPRRTQEMIRAGYEDVPTQNSNRINDFASQFEEIISNPEAYNNFAALIVRNGNIYCRKSQIKKLSRARYYVEMLEEGLHRQRDSVYQQALANTSIPVLIKHDDSNGCYPAKRHDKYIFPRLSWSIPLENNLNWCAVAGMPSYKAWRDASKSTRHKGQYWLDTFEKNNDQYPWETKINMAVWRGATTFNKSLYGHLDFDDIPRVKLVQKSKENKLIDAAFHKLVGKYEDEMQTPAYVKTLMKDSIPLDEMMRYKAIIDIDGNNWSARFGSLLCSNSAVIKIQPDFVEESFKELSPNIHYIPATIDNLTDVVERVLDEDNEPAMKQIVVNANKWCQTSMTAEALADSALVALENYIEMLKRYDIIWKGHGSEDFPTMSFNDLVPCRV